MAYHVLGILHSLKASPCYQRSLLLLRSSISNYKHKSVLRSLSSYRNVYFLNPITRVRHSFFFEQTFCNVSSLRGPFYFKTTHCNYDAKYFSSNSTLNNKYNHGRDSVRNKSTLYYVVAIGILAVGLSYAAVPLYRIFCQAYSYGGTVQQEENSSKVESLVRREDRDITIRFNADTATSMTWNFKPQQIEIKVKPGETALAFYSARNPTDKQVIGISTYNVIPFDAGQYFNKIQCFCFEEQMLNPKEEVSMPVFFYIDPEFADDPRMEFVNEITLSYTFFEAKEGVKLPIPSYIRK